MSTDNHSMRQAAVTKQAPNKSADNAIAGSDRGFCGILLSLFQWGLKLKEQDFFSYCLQAHNF